MSTIKIPARVEHNAVAVLTTEQIAEYFGCEPQRIKQNFNNNKDRFVEGKHYFMVSGEALDKLRVENFALQISPMTRSLYLWAKRGAARHAKMLNTDRAWEVFEVLEDSYFNTKTPAPMTALPEIINNPDAIITICQNWKSDRAKIAELEVRVTELEPKANYCDMVLNCKDLVPITVIAKDYGMSAVKMNEILHKLGVQFKHGRIWLLYQKYARLGWTSSKTFVKGVNGSIHANSHTYWTQSGRRGLYELLKNHGYLPTVERNGQLQLF